MNETKRDFRRLCAGLAAIAGALLWLFAQTASAQLPAITLDHIEALEIERAARTPAQRKMDSQLVYFTKQSRKEVIAAAIPHLRAEVKVDAQSRMIVDIDAVVSQDLLDKIALGGGAVLSQFPALHAVRAMMPPSMVESFAERQDVRFIQPAAEGMTNLGTVTSEGDRTHRADTARATFGADGTGVKIGVLSDGVNSLSTSVANGILHAVTVLSGG